MADRLHIVLDAAEKERFREMAAREGRTLSEWVRDAAREKAATAEAERMLDTVESLEAFFEECGRRETGVEPEWESHREVIERSIASGAGG
jgi:Ribbon-helix-helix protein, copG family